MAVETGLSTTALEPWWLWPCIGRELLREAVKQVPQADGLAEQLQAIDRRIRETKRKTENCLAAVERGGAGMKVILTRLDDLEAERLSLLEQRGQVELQLAESKLSRPTVEDVQARWQYFLALWELADEAQRQRLLPCLVERVDLEDKERGMVTLSLVGFQNPVREISASENVVIKSDKGPQTCAVNTLNPADGEAEFTVPAGGRSRKKVPKPWQQGVEMVDHVD